MNRTVVAGLALLATMPARAYAMGIVYDPAAVAQDIQMVHQGISMLNNARQIYQTDRAELQSLTGITNIQSLLSNPVLGQMLPGSWQGVYGAVQGGGFDGITGALNSVTEENVLPGNADNQLLELQQEQGQVPFDDAAISENAYAMEQRRYQELQREAYAAGRQQNMKEAIDVGNEIKAQNNIMAAEDTKVRLIGMMEENKRRLMEAQQAKIASHIYDPANDQYAAISQP